MTQTWLWPSWPSPDLYLDLSLTIWNNDSFFSKSLWLCVKVLLGEHDYSDDNESDRLIARVDRIIEHPDYAYDPVPVKDFAMLRLKEPVNFDAYPHIRPICLPFSNDRVVILDKIHNISYFSCLIYVMCQNYAGDTATVTGWGTTSYNGYLSSTLREVNVTVLTNEDCGWEIHLSNI